MADAFEQRQPGLTAAAPRTPDEANPPRKPILTTGTPWSTRTSRAWRTWRARSCRGWSLAIEATWSKSAPPPGPTLSRRQNVRRYEGLGASVLTEPARCLAQNARSRDRRVSGARGRHGVLVGLCACPTL